MSCRAKKSYYAMKVCMKRKIFKILILGFAYVTVSLGIYFILKQCGLASVNQIRDFVLQSGGWCYLVFFVFQVTLSTFICVIPFEDELLTGAAIVLFGPIKGFFVASFNMFTTSCIQYFIGRYFFKGLIAKIIGGEKVEKYQNTFKVKGMVLLPAMYLIPFFPHDSLCILSGLAKIKFWYFSIITFIMRSMEIASLCFLGSGLINFESFEVIDWIVVINLVIIDAYLLIKLQKHIEHKINKT